MRVWGTQIFSRMSEETETMQQFGILLVFNEISDRGFGRLSIALGS